MTPLDNTPASLITVCSGITVNANDGLPEWVCDDCLEALVQAYNIRIKCISSDRKLRENRQALLPPLAIFNESEAITTSSNAIESEAVVESKPVDTKFRCPICNKVFKTNGSMKGHISYLHQNKKPFCCEVCGRRFYNKTAYNNHMNRHYGHRPFPCTMCEKTFVCIENMKVHRNTKHLAMKQYGCRYSLNI
ncbi:zinc finger protein 721-like [Anopheles nili]|uniref:zinc finger protein 721-like n=1 Tax=Anopheles nili TaxID=185578 RepID=UPI00237BEFEE|nr:zinc finger protein 721-like [Anopheles nili]